MGITEGEWESIATMVERIVADVAGSRRDYFITGKVTKVDKLNQCVYLDEFADQPIPVVGFDYEIMYYDNDGSKVSKKQAAASVVMPKVGSVVLVAREMGTRRLPRCLGVILGTNWIMTEED